MRIRNSFSLLGITFFWLFLTVQNSNAQCLEVDIEVIVDQFANPCNGPITLDAHYPGYNFLWSTGETTGKIVVTKSDTYIVTVDDGMGCVGKDTLQVTFMNKPSIDLGADPASQCGGCVTLNPGSDPGLTYLWSTGQTSNQISFCEVGEHDVWVKVTNSLGCFATDTVHVEITPGLDVDLGPDIITCDSASVKLMPDITGTSYLWNTGETTNSIEVTTSGYYSVIVSNGTCSGVDTIHVLFNSSPVIDLGPDLAAQCGGCITVKADVTPKPGYNYQWSNGFNGSILKVCEPGIHTVNVKVTSDKGCVGRDTITFELTPGLTVNLGPDVSVCKSSYLIKSNVTAGSILWNTGATTPDILVTSSGTYYIDVTDGSCKGVDTIKVNLLSNPVVNLGPDPAAQCGGCVTLEVPVQPGYTYQWSNGETGNKLKVCEPGNYNITVKVTSDKSCTANDTIQFELLPGITVDLGPDVSVCKLQHLIKSNIASSSILWNTGATTPDILVTTSGTYYVDVSEGGCKGVDSIKVKLLSVPDIDLGPDQDPACGGCQTISVPFNSDLDYIWSTGETGNSIKYCKIGKNEVALTVVNSDGCKDSDTILVEIQDKFDFSINQGMDTTVCKGPVSLNASIIPGASYYWNTGDKTSSIAVNGSGNYYVFVFNLPGCNSRDTLSDTIAVTFRNPFPSSESITDLSDCQKYKYQASPVAGATYYTWTVPSGVTIMSGQGTRDVVLSAPGNVTGTLSVKASNSSPTCAGDATEIEIVLGERKVSIPNAFTPNGDGLNDTWVIRNIQYYPDNSLVILNRWGNEVYKKNNYASQWDGSSLNEGSYFYKLIINSCGEVKELTGYVTIVR